MHFIDIEEEGAFHLWWHGACATIANNAGKQKTAQIVGFFNAFSF
jgi:hypothetical protein